MAAWSPTALDGMVAWFDAAETSSIVLDADNAIQTWTSRVGSMSVTGPRYERPAYSTSARTGKPAALFSPNQYLNTTSGLDALPYGTAPGTIIVVSYLDVGGNIWTPVFAYGAAQGQRAREIFSMNDTRKVGFSVLEGDRTTTVPWDDDRVIITTIADGSATTVRQYVDGTATPWEYNISFDTLKGSLVLGSHIGGGGFWKGTIQEIMIVNRIITAEERVKLEGYLAWKWDRQGNLPAGHLYKSAAPQEAVVVPPTNCSPLYVTRAGQSVQGKIWFMHNGVWTQANSAYARRNGTWQLICSDGTPVVVTSNNILMENGDTFTLENGDTLVMEG